MGHLTRSNVQVVTVDGECKIHLTLDINLNVANTPSPATPVVDITEVALTSVPEAKPLFEVPEFESGKNKIKFGKKD
jgi:hypothetical protein